MTRRDVWSRSCCPSWRLEEEEDFDDEETTSVAGRAVLKVKQMSARKMKSWVYSNIFHAWLNEGRNASKNGTYTAWFKKAFESREDQALKVALMHLPHKNKKNTIISMNYDNKYQICVYENKRVIMSTWRHTTVTITTFHGRRHFDSGSHGPIISFNICFIQSFSAAIPFLSEPVMPQSPPLLFLPVEKSCAALVVLRRHDRERPLLAKAIGEVAVPWLEDFVSSGTAPTAFIESLLRRKRDTTSLCCRSRRFCCASLSCCRFVR